MMRVRTLGRDRRGTSAMEFALLAPVFFGFLMLLFEGGRMQWTQQAIQEVAANAARCMALGAGECKDSAGVQSYARQRGRDWGVSLTGATIGTAANQTCNAMTGMNRVTVSLPYSTVAGKLLPAGPERLEASHCFPSIV